MFTVHNLGRRELYDLVWAVPIAKLAPRFEITDRGLAKVCQRRRVPVPTRGYWERKAAGKPVEVPPLPDDLETAHEPAPIKPRKTRRKLDDALLEDLRRSIEVASRPERARPTKNYHFRVVKWGWEVEVGIPGPKPRHADDTDVFPTIEDIVIEGLLEGPKKLPDRSVRLTISPTGKVRSLDFRATKRAHVGAIEFEDEGLRARAALPTPVTSTLVAMLIAGRPVEITFTTEPDGEREEIVVTVRLMAAVS